MIHRVITFSSSCSNISNHSLLQRFYFDGQLSMGHLFVWVVLVYLPWETVDNICFFSCSDKKSSLNTIKVRSVIRRRRRTRREVKTIDVRAAVLVVVSHAHTLIYLPKLGNCMDSTVVIQPNNSTTKMAWVLNRPLIKIIQIFHTPFICLDLSQ